MVRVLLYELFLCVNLEQWATSADTPLWLWIGETVPVEIGRLRGRVPSLVQSRRPGTYDIPIYLKPGVEYERVLEDVICQLKSIADLTIRE